MDLTDTFYNCTRGNFHSDECDENCGEYTPNDTDKELLNELKRWEMLQFPFVGVPSILAGTAFQGILVDPLETLIRIQSLVELLVDKGIVTQDEVDDAMTAKVLRRMKALRKKIEQERSTQRLAVVKKGLLDPSGKPFQ